MAPRVLLSCRRRAEALPRQAIADRPTTVPEAVFSRFTQ